MFCVDFLGCKTIHFTSVGQVDEVVNDDTVTHIFVSPEHLQELLKPVLLNAPLETKRRFSYIFVDESHCVVKW